MRGEALNPEMGTADAGSPCIVIFRLLASGGVRETSGMRVCSRSSAVAFAKNCPCHSEKISVNLAPPKAKNAERGKAWSRDETIAPREDILISRHGVSRYGLGAPVGDHSGPL